MTFQRQNNVFDNAIIPVRITNTTAETIPPYSCVAIGETADLTPGVFVRSGSGFGAGDFLVPVRKPDATAIGGGSISQFLITLDLPIPADKEGYATPSLPVWAGIDTAVTARATNLGPVAASWLLGAVDGFYNAVDLRTIGALKYAYVQPAGGVGGASMFRFELTADYSTGTSVAATIKTMAGSTVGTGISLQDPEAIFLGLPSGAKGYCIFQDAAYYAVQAACAAEVEYV